MLCNRADEDAFDSSHQIQLYVTVNRDVVIAKPLIYYGAEIEVDDDHGTKF